MKKFALLVSLMCATVAGFAQNTLWGNVSYKGQSTYTHCMVYAIEKCGTGSNTSLHAIDSTMCDSLGYYSFKFMPQPSSGCDLLVKAALTPQDAQYANYLPSYYVTNTTSSLIWSGATAVTTTMMSNAVKIELTKGTNPGGPGFVGGLVVQGANKGTGVGDPLKDKIIILTDNNDNAIAYTHSDAQGKFSFNNIPYGSYKMFGDAPGKNNPALALTIDASNSPFNDVVFRENSTAFQGYITTSVVNVNGALTALNVYPNPVQNDIHVSGLEKIDGGKQVVLSNVTGAVVYSHYYNAGEEVVVPASNLTNGVYMMQLQTEAGNASFKIVK